MMNFIKKYNALFTDNFNCVFNYLTPLFDLAVRLYVAYAFFISGLTKLDDFSSTIALFENEYKVPILSPQLAAYLGTATELTLPVILTLGIFSRPAALVLFIFNLVAVTSYPDISDAGIKDHLLWGALMLVTLFHGAGKLSLDHFLFRKT